MEYRSEVGLPTSDAMHPEAATKFLANVYAWMFGGLVVTTFVSGVVMGSPTLLLAIAGNPAVFFGLIIAELALVLILSAAINKISAGLATAMFFLYSAVNGATLSIVLLAYTEQSVFRAFLSASCLFAAMSVYGFFTKRDLTSWGSLLTIGLIGLIISMVINMFLRSSTFDYVVSLVGVVVFLGLTAYDVQKILRFGATAQNAGPAAMRKGAIIGALELYLDFINLFLYMLRLFGKRK